ncbi:MAG: hypothetical protein JNJ78_14055 [Anaerolineae bacterium]|nr:hypothetical protein [Anaerolineae bacterium]
MIRLVLRLTLPLLTLFTLMTGVLRARPADEALGDTLLKTGDCAAFCLLEIQPGWTTADDATQRLLRSGWLDDLRVVEVASLPQHLTRIEWDWAAQPPPAFAHVEGAADGWLDTRDGLVERLSVMLDLRLGDLYARLGTPHQLGLGVQHYPDVLPGVRLSYLYPQSNLNLQTLVPTCPYYPGLWHEGVLLSVGRLPNTRFPGATEYIRGVNWQRSIITRERLVCR